MFKTVGINGRYIQEPVLSSDQIVAALTEIQRQAAALIDLNVTLVNALTTRPEVGFVEAAKVESSDQISAN